MKEPKRSRYLIKVRTAVRRGYEAVSFGFGGLLPKLISNFRFSQEAPKLVEYVKVPSLKQVWSETRPKAFNPTLQICWARMRAVGDQYSQGSNSIFWVWYQRLISQWTSKFSISIRVSKNSHAWESYCSKQFKLRIRNLNYFTTNSPPNLSTHKFELT